MRPLLVRILLGYEMQHTEYRSSADYLVVFQELWTLLHKFASEILSDWNTALDCCLELMFLPFTVHGSQIG